ncbi:MAG TPA: indole-3-glycerol-phosphate synthase TrpC, partial [Acetobacteraceae bacterium]|nr:indole-3-glycerol-phosphate synthase TrpC [Acetobacteraceae bacterium]
MSDTAHIPASDVLARICSETRAAVAQAKAKTGVKALQSEIAARHDPPRGFGSALKEAVAQGRFGLVAEIKK